MATWGGNVGEENARWLATECRTARLASEYRPRDRGGGVVEISALALGALRELIQLLLPLRGREPTGDQTADAGCDGTRHLTWITHLDLLGH